jgi:hypothetical protein
MEPTGPNNTYFRTMKATKIKFKTITKSTAKDVVNQIKEFIGVSVELFGRETIISCSLRYQLECILPYVIDDLGQGVVIEYFDESTEDGVICSGANNETFLVGKKDAEEGLLLLSELNPTEFISKFLKAILGFKTIYLIRL